jgi:ribose 5-phosphate isomerase A
MTQDDAKHEVAKRAVTFVADGMRVGLGTGTTATMFIRELAAKVKAEGLKIRCVASSDASHKLAAELGLAITTLDQLPELDIYLDGADEVCARDHGQLQLIKGGGGALLREKIVASAAKKFIVLVDSSKIVQQLGKFPLPVEVVKMALPLVMPRLEALGLNPRQRPAKSGDGPYLTDENNYIVDCFCGVIHDPARTAEQIRHIVGVVEHGLFLHMASMVLIAGEEGVSAMEDTELASSAGALESNQV